MGGCKSPEEEEIINRAKTTLMEYLGFTEPQAHRYIEKHAMDMRVTKIEIAINILKIYES
ncbi:MAG: ANTAR domain-containing protein [Eubacteriales bacterium]